MTITLTKEELRDFTNALEKWYLKMVEFTLEKLPNVSFRDFDMMHSATVHQKIHDLMARYEKENPKPDWRNLL